MGFKCGIVGLPNVGKSTLFNALTKASVDASNYPFCTIEPNVGAVEVPDSRLEAIKSIIKPKRTIPAMMQFVDIAGLIEGASKGEGLGNQFLGHIRETQAIVHVVRCFEADDITHVSQNINPKSDIDTINTELMLSDLATLQSIEAKQLRFIKKGGEAGKQAQEQQAVLKKLYASLEQGLPASSVSLDKEESNHAKHFHLLTSKPMLYVANVSENQIKDNPFVAQVQKIADQTKSGCVTICTHLEASLAELPPEDQALFLEDLGWKTSGLHRLIRAGYHLLGLKTFFTAGVNELRAWTTHIQAKAPEAAGVIHSDFEKQFIRCEVVSYHDYIRLNGEQGAKEAGLWRVEGKTYTIKDGDIVYFRHAA